MQVSKLVVFGLMLIAPLLGHAEERCRYRGDLDKPYCDKDRDYVADTPTEPTKHQNPNTLAFSWTPVENPAIYRELLTPFTEHLANCTGRNVVFVPAQSNTEEIELMRTGRLHIGSFSTGPTWFAVNIAGAVPFAVKGTAEKFQGYSMLLIVRKDSRFQKITDLKGSRIAHTSPSSNSGNLTPRALLPKQGLTPDKDYTVIFSGRHDSSVLGVQSGEYDAAAVASDVFHRMVARGQIKEDEFRTLYTSPWFPTESLVYAHDLSPTLRDRMLKCFYDYRFTPEMQKQFDGADRFVPVTFKKEWEIIRFVAISAGESFDRTAYEKEIKREQEAHDKSK
ncbi:MAG: phosphate/phosphite/phosphonate ABC transporter substrate-binding protein [Gammaproteobacteria bacterium]|nr:phosphate/phosphite/phosphonate ABC transporter substrate-binding protein [Gammaproteobacteria bacterium]